MTYETTRLLGTPPRHESWDLALTRREETRLQSEFASELRLLCTGNDITRGLWREVSEEARKRANIGSGSPRSLTIPTNAQLWKPTPQDAAAIARRDATVGGSAGYLVATQNDVSFVELLRNRMVALRMGATRLSGLVGNVTVPKQTVGATAFWLASEDTAITEGNQTFEQLAMTPNTVGALTRISRLLQLQSSPSADSLIMADLAQQVAIAADLAVLAGTGTDQPQGIIGLAGVGSFSGTSLDTVGLLDAMTDVVAANALTPTCGFVTTATVAGLLMSRSRFSSALAAPLWEGSLLDGTILGMRAMSSSQMPAGKMVFGDWSQAVIGEWGTLELSTSPSAESGDFAKGITSIRALYTMDVGVKHAAAFSCASSIT